MTHLAKPALGSVALAVNTMQTPVSPQVLPITCFSHCLMKASNSVLALFGVYISFAPRPAMCIVLD